MIFHNRPECHEGFRLADSQMNAYYMQRSNQYDYYEELPCSATDPQDIFDNLVEEGLL